MNSFEVFPWNENFDTGIKAIDEQHKKLVDLLNKLARHVAFQSDLPKLKNIFQELSEYADYHFQTEEEIWHRYLGVDDTWCSNHKNTHNNFLIEIDRIQGLGNSHPIDAQIEELLSFLTHWLAFHILEDDKRMAICVTQIRSGKNLDQSKNAASECMNGAIKILIETILGMYDHLSVRTLQLMKEIIERQKVEAKLRLASNAIENTLEAICITDANFNIIEVNPAFYQTTLLSPEDVTGKNLKNLKDGLQNRDIEELIQGELSKNGHWYGEVTSHNRNGEPDTEWLTLSLIKDEKGNINNYVALFTNISNLIQERSKLELTANYDMLTGLPNRHLLVDKLNQAIEQTSINNTLLALCYMDLDGFKEVNDTLGHAAGDHVLWELSQRFLKTIPESDTILRMGGDEFVIIINQLQEPGDCIDLVNKILRQVELPIMIKEKTASISASIGITIFPQKGVDKDSLLKLSDHAMYQAKNTEKSRFHFSSPDNLELA